MNSNASTVKAITILDYIGIFCILGFFIEKDNEDVRFHTNQGLILLLFDIVLGVASVVLQLLRFIPVVGWIFGLVSWLLGLAAFAFMILGIVHAAQGERRPLPLIGNLFSFIK